MLRIPSLSIRAAIEPVVTRHGVLGVPGDVGRVGWWTGSATPADASGTVVIDGHVDSARRGRGALFHLTNLRAGDAVSLVDGHGGEVVYRVDAQRTYSKVQSLPAGLFASGGPARLVLITCGGPFDATTRSYDDNVVVFAHPAARPR